MDAPGQPTPSGHGESTDRRESAGERGRGRVASEDDRRVRIGEHVGQVSNDGTALEHAASRHDDRRLGRRDLAVDPAVRSWQAGEGTAHRGVRVKHGDHGVLEHAHVLDVVGAQSEQRKRRLAQPAGRRTGPRTVSGANEPRVHRRDPAAKRRLDENGRARELIVLPRDAREVEEHRLQPVHREDRDERRPAAPTRSAQRAPQALDASSERLAHERTLAVSIRALDHREGRRRRRHPMPQ